ncbi:MAG: endolytic transglycosylase MltG [Verrucomicrobiota bacterium]
MVERPHLTRGPTRRQIHRRRLVALVVVLVVFGGCAWAAYAVVRGRHDSAAPPPATTLTAPKQVRVTFPEGFTTRQMAQVAGRTSQLITPTGYVRAAGRARLPAGFGRPASPEGFLFPDTYFVFETDPAAALVEKQLENFRAKWSRVDLRYARSKNLTPYDVLTIASMIEKEVVVPKERRLVAAVIYNRLHERMPLGIDATLRYGLGILPTKAITKRDLASDSPYNTRRFRGLPPTPIANPGLASMQAAAHPAKVDYLYFVRTPDCRSHFFTASIEEFDAYTRQGLTNC